MNKRLSLLVILISLFLLWTSHARAGTEDNEAVYKVTEGEHLEVLSHMNKIKNQNEFLLNDNKRLEKQNGDYFVQNRQMTKEMETISRKGLARTLFQQEEQGGLSSDISSFLSAPNPFLTTAVQKEGRESLKLSLDRSSDFSSSSFLPQAQGSDSGGYLQELVNKIAEQEQMIKALTQQLETYQNIQKTDQTPLSSSETHLSQINHEGIQPEQFNSSVLETKHQERGESEKVFQEEETDTLSKLRIAFNKIRSFLIKDEEEREADVSLVRVPSSSPVQEDQQHLTQETAELRQQVTDLSEHNKTLMETVTEQKVLIDQQQEQLVRQEEQANEQRSKIEQQESDLEDSRRFAAQQKEQADQEKEDFLVRLNQQKLILEQEQKKLAEANTTIETQKKKEIEVLELYHQQLAQKEKQLDNFRKVSEQRSAELEERTIALGQKDRELSQFRTLIQQREEELKLVQESFAQANLRIERQQKTLEERQKEFDQLAQAKDKLKKDYQEELDRQKIAMIQQKQELLEERDRQRQEQAVLMHQANAEREKILENLAQVQEQYTKKKEEFNAEKNALGLAKEQRLKDLKAQEELRDAMVHLRQTLEKKEKEATDLKENVIALTAQKDTLAKEYQEKEVQFHQQVKQTWEASELKEKELRLAQTKHQQEFEEREEKYKKIILKDEEDIAQLQIALQKKESQAIKAEEEFVGQQERVNKLLFNSSINNLFNQMENDEKGLITARVSPRNKKNQLSLQDELRALEDKDAEKMFDDVSQNRDYHSDEEAYNSEGDRNSFLSPKRTKGQFFPVHQKSPLLSRKNSLTSQEEKDFRKASFEALQQENRKIMRAFVQQNELSELDFAQKFLSSEEPEMDDLNEQTLFASEKDLIINRYQQALEEKENRYQEEKRNLDEIYKINQTLNEEREELVKQLSISKKKQQKEIKQSLVSLEEKQAVLSSLLQEKEDLEKKVNEHKEKLETYRLQISQGKKDRKSIEQDYDLILKENDLLRNNYESLDIKYAQMQKKLKEKLEETEETATEYYANWQKIKKENENLREENDALTPKVSFLMTKVEKLKEKKTQWKQEQDQIIPLFNNLKQQLEETEKERDEYATSLEMLKKVEQGDNDLFFKKTPSGAASPKKKSLKEDKRPVGKNSSAYQTTKRRTEGVLLEQDSNVKLQPKVKGYVAMGKKTGDRYSYINAPGITISRYSKNTKDNDDKF